MKVNLIIFVGRRRHPTTCVTRYLALFKGESLSYKTFELKVTLG